MSEKKIIIEISEDGSIQADATGFTKDICLRELEKLMAHINARPVQIKRKDQKPATRKTVLVQHAGRKK